MSLYVFDTDTFSLYQDGDPAVVANILGPGGHQLAVSGTTVEEVLGGWLHRVRIAEADVDRAFGYAQYAASVEALAGWPVLPLPVPALGRFAALNRSRLNIGGNDLRIAAVALEAGGIVVTRDLRDFRRVPGLVCEDWSV
jgi:tRNA(fMet)-specific endonuclease VapC